MAVFEELLELGKTAAMASVSEMEGGDWTDAEFSVADSSFQAVDEIVPERVDIEWCLAVLRERPALLGEDSDGRSLGDAVRNAVRDLIVEEIEDELIEHARSIGLDIPVEAGPTR